MAAGVGEDLHHVAVLHRGAQRHQLGVDPGAGALVTQLGVHPVGEVERGGAAGEGEDLPLGAEGVDLVGVEVDLERGEEGAGVLDLLLPLEQLPQPEDVEVALVAGRLPLLVAPVGGDPLLGHLVHVAGADLHLEGLPPLAHHRGVERLVEVGLGHRDVVLEAAGDGAPVLVDDAQRAVGVADVGGDDAKRLVVVELGDVDALAPQLLVDRVVALDPEGDLGLDPGLLEALGQRLGDALHRPLADPHLLGDLRVQLGELVRVEVVEGEVLEVALDPAHPQAVGDRGVDLDGLPRDPPARLGRHRLQRLHVVEAIGQLDHHHPDVLRRGEDHLAEGLGLRLVPAHVLVAADLGHPVDQLGDLLAELVLQGLAGGEGVLEDVVEQADGGADVIELEVGEQVGDGDRVAQVGLAGAPLLVLVHLGREVVDRAQPGLVVQPVVLPQATQDVVEPG